MRERTGPFRGKRERERKEKGEERNLVGPNPMGGRCGGGIGRRRKRRKEGK